MHRIRVGRHVALETICCWLNDHVGTTCSKEPFRAKGPGWSYMYSHPMRMPDGSVLPSAHVIQFEDHVDADLITQFALTFS